MFTYFVHARPGIEQIAWLEIRQTFPKAKFQQYLYAKDAYGIVIFDCAEPIEALIELKTVDAVFLSVLSLPKVTRGRQDLRDIRQKLIESGNIGQAVNLVGRWRRKHLHTYNLTIHKEGRHQYSQGELANLVTRGMEQLYPHWSVKKSRPDIPLRADLLGSHLLVGIQLTHKLQQESKAALPVSVAEAMVFLSNPAGTDTFFDPLPVKTAILKGRLASGAKTMYGGIGVGKMWRLPAGVIAQKWHRGRFPMADQSVDKVVSYWPDNFVDSYPALLAELERILTGRAVILTRRYDEVKEMMRSRPGLQVKTGYSVMSGDEWGRIYIIERATK